jgi:hypothetical protein
MGKRQPLAEKADILNNRVYRPVGHSVEPESEYAQEQDAKTGDLPY